MLDVGRDRLGVAGTDLDFERRLARHGKTQPPLVNHDPPPRACGETVCTAQPARHSLLVPLGAEANETETVWELAPVARRAAEQSAEPGRPSVVVGHPISELERGTVTDMLAVTARKLGDPVACVVLVVAGDRSFHGRQPTSGSSNIADAHISRAPRGRPGGAVRFGSVRRGPAQPLVQQTRSLAHLHLGRRPFSQSGVQGCDLRRWKSIAATYCHDATSGG